jgi:anti-sigma factor RsiW
VTCDECQALLSAYADHELELVKSLEIERHILECEACGQMRCGLGMLSTTIDSASLYQKAPPLLEQRIRAQLPRPIHRRPRAFNWNVFSAAAVVAVCGTLGWAVLHGTQSGPDRQLAMDVVADHARSLMATHLYDVESTDQHTVKPWLDERLDYAADVRDFKADGFPLKGGRLDYLAGRSVAALVYGHEKHYVNLFTWPATDAATREPTFESRQGYALAHWTRSGMNYWAISDTSEETMRRFAKVASQAK